MSSATDAVTILKSTWTDAALLALAVAPMAAIIAVTEDPILAPMTAAAASVRGIAVVLASVRIAAVDALEDCMMSVNTSHPRKNPNTESTHIPLIDAKSMIESAHASEDWRNPIPRKSIPNPVNISPTGHHLRPDANTLSRTHIPIIGNENASTLILSQINATSQPVIVVPTLAPNISQRE